MAKPLPPAEAQERRKALKLTQEALASEFGLTRVTVNRWESTGGEPPMWLDDALAGIESRRTRLTREELLRLRASLETHIAQAFPGQGITFAIRREREPDGSIVVTFSGNKEPIQIP